MEGNVITLIIMEFHDGLKFVNGKRYMRLWIANGNRHYIAARKGKK